MKKIPIKELQRWKLHMQELSRGEGRIKTTLMMQKETRNIGKKCLLVNIDRNNDTFA